MFTDIAYRRMNYDMVVEFLLSWNGILLEALLR